MFSQESLDLRQKALNAWFLLPPPSSVGDLLKIKEELTSERDQLLSEVVTLRDDLTKATATQQEMEAQKEMTMESISQVGP